MSVAQFWTDAGMDPTACPKCGQDSCEDESHWGDPTDDREDTGPTRPRLTAIPALQLLDAPRPVEIIEGIAAAGCLSVLVAESGAGKTFALLSQAASVVDGIRWCGRGVRQGSALYLCYEGDALGLRLRALRDVIGHRLEHLYLIGASDPLSPLITRDGERRSLGEIAVTDAIETLSLRLASEGKPPVVWAGIDTVRASMTGSEDSSDHVAAYLRAVRRLMRCLPGAACALAHHAGWQDGEDRRKRERGSSAWRGNVDITLYLETDEYDAACGEAYLTLRTLKVRDWERPAPLHLIRRRVELPGVVDAYGQPVTSCIIESDRRTREDREAATARAAEAKHRATDLAVLRAMRDYPDATSITRLRSYVGQGMSVVSDSVARILSADWAVVGKRGKPYCLTESGHAQLNGGPA